MLAPYLAIVLAVAVGVICSTRRDPPPHRGFTV
jgi:hypothetical protein